MLSLPHSIKSFKIKFTREYSLTLLFVQWGNCMVMLTGMTIFKKIIPLNYEMTQGFTTNYLST